MFNPEEYVPWLSYVSIQLINAFFIRETEFDWDKDLAEDVKGECEEKYGHVEFIKVEKESQVSISRLHVISSN